MYNAALLMLYNPAEYKYVKSLGSVNEKVGKLSNVIQFSALTV